MTVTIIGTNEITGVSEKHTGIDYELVTIKETKKRNGYIKTEVRISRGKRDIKVASGTYSKITVQDDETGRYLLKYEA